MSAPTDRPVRHWLAMTSGLAALTSLAGCASLGGNVRGDFSCSAPDGICAPSSTIDDRALALISGDGASEDPIPARGSDRLGAPRGNRAEAGRATRLASGDAARTQERVLRIVFQPYIDDRGRLHEASAVHTVVARGEWQQQALNEAAVRPALPFTWKARRFRAQGNSADKTGRAATAPGGGKANRGTFFPGRASLPRIPGHNALIYRPDCPASRGGCPGCRDALPRNCCKEALRIDSLCLESLASLGQGPAGHHRRGLDQQNQNNWPVGAQTNDW